MDVLPELLETIEDGIATLTLQSAGADECAVDADPQRGEPSRLPRMPHFAAAVGAGAKICGLRERVGRRWTLG